MHSAPKFLEVMVAPECNKAAWAMQGKDTTQGPTFPMNDVHFHTEMGRNVCWN